jgi:DNA polymerase III delta prime subunit
MSLVGKYRPRRFEDVVGQKEAVQLLSGLILRGRAVRKILLHGPRGLGKTTLIPIYAMALNCMDVSPMGSACGVCKNCEQAPDYYRYYNVPKAPDKDAVLGWAEAHARPFGSGLKRTLFFDEAQAFDSAAMEALLAVLEDSEDIAFCFATTEPRKFKTSFKSRNLDVAVEPLSLKESMILLERTATAEGYTFERDALVLIATVKRGYARDLLQGLEQVFRYNGEITSDAVKAVLDLDQGQDLINYLVSLINSDEKEYLAARRRWRATAAEKIVLIRAFLTSLFYRNILNQNIAISPTADAIMDGRQQILSTLNKHLRSTREGDLRSAVAAMMEFWFEATIDVDDGALESQLACFEEFVRQLPERSTGKVGPQVTQKIHEVPESAPSAGLSVRSRVNKFLQYADIRDIINRASFFVQHYGKPFNTSCIVAPSADFANDEASAITAAFHFCDDLVSNFARGGDFAFIALPERDGAEVYLRVVAHLPHVKNTRDVLSLMHNQASNLYELFELEIAAGTPRQQHRTHWKMILSLCSGFVSSATDPCSDLLGNLGIALSHRRTPGPLAQSSPIFSTRLSDEALAQACELEMDYLSPFDAEQWSCIGADWEIAEFRDRREEILSRKQMLADLEVALGKDSPTLVEAVTQLKGKWKGRPEDRSRTWSRGRWF